MISHKTNNESKVILEENEILVVSLKDKDNALICKTHNKCMIGLTINQTTIRELTNCNIEQKLINLGFKVFYKSLDKDELFTLSSIFSTSSLDVKIFEKSTGNNSYITWETVERENALSFIK